MDSMVNAISSINNSTSLSKKYDFNAELYNYQKDGIKFMIESIDTNNFVLNSDDVGLGKTIQTIGTLLHFIETQHISHIFIICKKSIIKQWQREINRFTNLKDDFNIITIGETPAERELCYKAYEDSKSSILILNYHTFINDYEKLIYVPIDFCVIDEVHSIKNREGVMNNNICDITSGKPTILLTGTPIMSKASDIFGIFKIANEDYFGDYDEFKETYLITKDGKYGEFVAGYKDLKTLSELVNKVMIRRMVSQVGIQLPDILWSYQEVGLDNIQRALITKSEIFKRNLRTEVDRLKSKGFLNEEEEAKLVQCESSLKGMISIDQMIVSDPHVMIGNEHGLVKAISKDILPDDYKGSPKTELCLSLVEDIIQSNKKVIIFSKFKTCVMYLAETIKNNLKSETLVYTGEQDQKERERAYSLFTESDNYNILLGTEAMAEGLNLQVASYLINYDQPDTSAIKTQRVGRIRRVNSKYESVIVYDLISICEEPIQVARDVVVDDYVTKDQERYVNIKENDNLSAAILDGEVDRVQTSITGLPKIKIEEEFNIYSSIDERDGTLRYIIRISNLTKDRLEKYKELFKQYGSFYSNYLNGFVMYNDPIDFVMNCPDEYIVDSGKPDVDIDWNNYAVFESTDTRDNSKLWVVRNKKFIDKDAFKQEAETFKKLGGFYSKFKRGYIFRKDPLTL